MNYGSKHNFNMNKLKSNKEYNKKKLQKEKKHQRDKINVKISWLKCKN